jgi:hypothetical protein
MSSVPAVWNGSVTLKINNQHTPAQGVLYGMDSELGSVLPVVQEAEAVVVYFNVEAG